MNRPKIYSHSWAAPQLRLQKSPKPSRHRSPLRDCPTRMRAWITGAFCWWLIVEKGTPGFTVEQVNDLMGYDGIYNCYLSFNNARVPVANRLGEEGNGWRVLTSGLNVERICTAGPPMGQIREAIRYAVQHLERRVQFGARTGDIVTNQFKIADMVKTGINQPRITKTCLLNLAFIILNN